MKKIALFSIIFLAACGLRAQLTLSPVFGANISTLNVTKLKEDIAPGLRYYVGVQAKHALSAKFSTGLGLQYTLKGYNVNTPDTGSISSAWLNYLDISPFVEFRPILSLGFLAGGSLGINLHEGYKIIGARDRPILSLNNPLDISAFLGARYYFDAFFLSLQYSNSLIPISEITYTDENGNVIANAKEYNQNLQIGVGFNFQLKKK